MSESQPINEMPFALAPYEIEALVKFLNDVHLHADEAQKAIQSHIKVRQRSREYYSKNKDRIREHKIEVRKGNETKKARGRPRVYGLVPIPDTEPVSIPAPAIETQNVQIPISEFITQAHQAL